MKYTLLTLLCFLGSFSLMAQKTVEFVNKEGYTVKVEGDKIVAVKKNPDNNASETITISTDPLNGNNVYEVVYKDDLGREERKEVYKEDLSNNVKAEIAHLGTPKMKKGKNDLKIGIDRTGKLTDYDIRISNTKWRVFDRDKNGQLVGKDKDVIVAPAVQCIEGHFKGKLGLLKNILSESKAKYEEANKKPSSERDAANTQTVDISGTEKFNLASDDFNIYADVDFDTVSEGCVEIADPFAWSLDFEDTEPEENEQSEEEDGSYYAGLRLGLPTGIEGQYFSIAYNGSAGYQKEVSDQWTIGVEVGYTRYTGKSTDFGFETEGVGFLPVKGRATFDLTDEFIEGLRASFGLGYAVGLGDGNTGGVNFDLEVGYPIKLPKLKSPCTWDLTFSYDSIQIENGSFNSIALGLRARR